MTERTGLVSFSERVSLHFKAAGKDARSDALLAELVEFLYFKKSLGVLPHWVKNAVVEQYLRETQGAEATPVPAAEGRAVSNQPVMEQPLAPERRTASLQDKPPVEQRHGQSDEAHKGADAVPVKQADSDQVQVSSDRASSSAPRAAAQGIMKLMG